MSNGYSQMSWRGILSLSIFVVYNWLKTCFHSAYQSCLAKYSGIHNILGKLQKQKLQNHWISDDFSGYKCVLLTYLMVDLFYVIYTYK